MLEPYYSPFVDFVNTQNQFGWNVVGGLERGVVLVKKWEVTVRRPLTHTTVREENESQESKSLLKMITDDPAG